MTRVPRLSAPDAPAQLAALINVRANDLPLPDGCAVIPPVKRPAYLGGPAVGAEGPNAASVKVDVLKTLRIRTRAPIVTT